ncbi:hypothetical protein OK074_7929 [Actinobacteria bacterium OK074]|nr:hypothetical protein OK074_7929 [Actinobacteria bacterium OK074]
MKLPAPDVTVDAYDPAGRIARFDPENAQMARPAIETTLDVQMVRMAAPDAKIVVTEIGLPTSAYSTVHPSGTPEPVPEEQEAGQETAESAAAGAELVLDGIAENVRRHRSDAISVSFGIEEYVAAGSTRQPAGDLAEFSTALAAVVAGGTTLVAGAGDSGAAPPIGPNGTRVKSVSWPASGLGTVDASAFVPALARLATTNTP